MPALKVPLRHVIGRRATEDVVPGLMRRDASSSLGEDDRYFSLVVPFLEIRTSHAMSSNGPITVSGDLVKNVSASGRGTSRPSRGCASYGLQNARKPLTSWIYAYRKSPFEKTKLKRLFKLFFLFSRASSTEKLARGGLVA